MTDDLLNSMALAAGLETGDSTADRSELDEPTFDRTPAGHLSFSWGYPDNIQIVIEGLHQKNRELWGEMTVLWQKDVDTRRRVLLNRKRINFRSTSNFESHDRWLRKRLDRDWRGRMEGVAAICENQNVSGTPAEWLDERPLPGPIEFHLDPILEAGEHTILYGDGDSGKSTLALAMALSVAEGVALLPGLKAEKSGRVLYLDWETDPAVHVRRLRAMMHGTGKEVPTRHIRYKRMHAPFADSIEEIRGEVVAHDISLIVCDSASMASGGLISDEVGVSAFFLAARSLGTTVLSIAHVAKSNDSRKPMGSTYWFNQARACWEITHDQTENESRYSIVLNHRKGNNQQRKRAIAFRVEFNGDESIVYHVTDPAAHEALNATLSLPRRIEHWLLLNEWKTAAEVAEGLDTIPRKVNAALLNGQRSGRFIRGGTKRPFIWAVAADELDGVTHNSTSNSTSNSEPLKTRDSPKGNLSKTDNSGTPLPTTTNTNIDPEELPW